MNEFKCSACHRPVPLGQFHPECGEVSVYMDRSEPKLSLVPPAPVAVVSPTGAPVLPAWVPTVAAAIVAVAAAVQKLTPAETKAHQIAALVVGVGAALGIVSHGARKRT